MTTPYSAASWSLPWRFLTIEASVWCFLFVTLFNLQGTRRSRRNIAIIQDFIPFVKHFFQKFLTFGPSCFLAALVVYHIQKRLSSTFFKFFSFAPALPLSSNFCSLPHRHPFVNRFFSKPFEFPLPPRPRRRTALLEYQTAHHLSTPFFTFFREHGKSGPAPQRRPALAGST